MTKHYFIANNERSRLNDLTKPIKIAADRGAVDGPKRVYFDFESYAELNAHIRKYPEISWHEVLRNGEDNTSQRLFFDIDAESTMLEEYGANFDQLLEIIIEEASDYARYRGAKNTNVIKLTCDRDEKRSAHLIFENVYVKSDHIKCAAGFVYRAVELALKMQEIPQELVKIIDMQVYDKNKTMRTHMSLKPNGQYPLINPDEKNTKFDHKTMITYVTENPHIIECGIDCQHGVDKIITIESDNEQLKALADVIEKMDGVSVRNIQNGFVNLLADHSKQCVVCGGKHESENPLGYVHNGFGCIKCRRTGRSIQVIKFGSKQFESDTQEIKADLVTKADRLPDAFDIITNNPRLFIKAGLGSGKTHQIQSFVEKHKNEKDFTVIFVTHRISLTRDIMRRVKGMGFTSYQDVKSDRISLAKYKRIIIQYESLHRLHIDCPLSFVFVDEVCANARQTQSGLNKQHSGSNITQFKNILNTSTRVVYADGLLDQDCIDSIENVTKMSDYFVWVNESETKLSPRVLTTKDIIKFRASIVADVKAGKKLYIATTRGGNWCEALSEFIKQKAGNDKSILTVHGDKDNTEVLEDVNEEFKQYDVVIASPTISAGISFDEEHFDRIYLFMCSEGPGAQDIIQSIRRVRSPRSNEIVVCDTTHIKNLPMKFEDVVNNEENRLYINTEEYIVNGCRIETRGIKSFFENKEDSILRFMFCVKGMINKDKHNIGASVIEWLKTEDASFAGLNAAPTVKMDNFELIKKSVKLSKDEEVATAEAITEREYEEIKARTRINAKDRAKVTRHQLTTLYQVENMNAAWVSKYSNKKVMKMFRNAGLRTQNIKTLVERDAEIIRNVDQCELMERRFVTGRHVLISSILAVVKQSADVGTDLMNLMNDKIKEKHPLLENFKLVQPKSLTRAVNLILFDYGLAVKSAGRTQINPPGKKRINVTKYEIVDILPDYFTVRSFSDNDFDVVDSKPIIRV